jgi:maltose-binding protein MalE
MMMRRFGFIFCFAIILISMMAACGQSTTTQSSSTPTPASTITTPSPASTVSTATPLATVGTTIPVTNTPTVTNGREVLVTVTNTQIQSSVTTFQENVPYTFIITNKGNNAQNFIIGKKTPQGQPAVGEYYIIPSDQLPSGKIRSFTYTFPSGSSQEHLEFTNHQQGPTGQGAELPIQVKGK